ncbi:hypothetical protein E2C01_039441 [Portunus trituberculatus]|uniref:Uncharacterized protein n=1 Tax=Portunus trituberculatus TaxID=210409 RepID=A0A5B7FJQ6_PORTR|nr:hypothetical protein [Portunus trituberculatus]
MPVCRFLLNVNSALLFTSLPHQVCAAALSRCGIKTYIVLNRRGKVSCPPEAKTQKKHPSFKVTQEEGRK